MRSSRFLPALALLLAASSAFAQGKTFTRPSYVPPSARTATRATAPSRAAPAAAEPAAPAAATNAPEEPPRFVTNAFGDLVEVKDYSKYRVPYGTSEHLKALIASPRFDLVSRHVEQVKDEDDWQEVLTQQKETGACILLRFVQTQDAPDRSGTVSSAERGRVKWFASKHGASKLWQEATRRFIQVDVMLPGKEFVERFEQRVRQGNKTLFFVFRPNDSHPFPVGVFSYDPAVHKMELKPLEECLQRLKDVATPAYGDIRTK